MTDNKVKSIGAEKTAAWAEQACHDPETNVTVPSEKATIDAKEWVEENQK